MAGEGEAEGSRGEVPDFDGAVAGTGRKPLVVWFDAHCADPAEVTGEDAVELPRCVPGGFYLVCGGGGGHCG